jgi:hypothetical protein
LVFSGDRAVPLDKVREWADALKLDDKERPEFYDLCLDAQSAELAASVGELRRQVRGLSLIVAPPADAIAVAIDEWAENQDKTLLSKLLIRVLSANLRLAGYVEGHTADAKAVTSVLHQNWTASQIGDALAALGEQLQPPRPSSPKPRGSDPGSAGSAPGRR